MNPLARLATVVFTPLLSILVIADPYIAGELMHVESYLALRWIRSASVLTIPIAGFVYALSRRRAWLWYVVAISFLSFATFVYTDAVTRAEVSERIEREVHGE